MAFYAGIGGLERDFGRAYSAAVSSTIEMSILLFLINSPFSVKQLNVLYLKLPMNSKNPGPYQKTTW